MTDLKLRNAHTVSRLADVLDDLNPEWTTEYTKGYGILSQPRSDANVRDQDDDGEVPF